MKNKNLNDCLIKMVIFDVDGVLTDGSIHFDSMGEAIKSFNVKDGIAISLLRSHGILSGIISGRKCLALDSRVRELKFDIALSGVPDKMDALKEICRTFRLLESEIAYVGDDVIDVPLAGVVGRFYAPSDAHVLARNCADFILGSVGGSGVARELAEHLLFSKGYDLDSMYRPMLASLRAANVVQ